mmetsp:Transcript_23874/g.28866  ORF Transcript_23874/g.28866 Transcript_23874/m.28866 type:complete len:248 (-) Transcript_23874:230-973(-)|eukprot:CAMPEP_0197846620 /NCGR_PEP_ID=MMETSP1438-20131217/3790_1 /TAXON_ID=1461541 /ORGANISM="Pterosperma sp., Strain CCMP1384" /LENGTH=247 /DNA_ID=CAMNT_0043458333 /DNA_START=48 /DNA_END=791 /DNA_ORIENTATION=+
MAAITKSVNLSARVASVSKGDKTFRRTAAAPRAARRTVAVTAAAKPTWYPGSPGPEYLDGSLPGDYGFDPLGLGADPKNLAWFQQAELMHARWAMLGVTGILVPEALTKAGILNTPVWFEAGAEGEYFTNGLTLFWMQMILMNWAEVRRWQDIKNPGSVNEDPIFKGRGFECTGTEVGYPGGRWFNPMGMASTPEAMATAKVKEIKNGRLAMLAMLGFATQAFVTKSGPVQNWIDHVFSSNHVTMFG